MTDVPDQYVALFSATPQDRKIASMIRFLLKCMRQTWLRRTLLILLLVLGASITFLDPCPVRHRVSEAVCTEHCSGKCHFTSALVGVPNVPSEPSEDVSPIWPRIQSPRDQAIEPEHGPPREG